MSRITAPPTPLTAPQEIISDESLGKYNKNPRLRVQKAENVNKSLDFIRSKGIALTNIGAEGMAAASLYLRYIY